MLTDFLRVFPGATAKDADRGCGRAEVGAGLAGGAKDDEGALRPLLGVLETDLFMGVAMPPVLLRVFGMGSAGRAMEGGPLEGRDGRGRVVAMVCLCVVAGKANVLLYGRGQAHAAEKSKGE
jgi:hypothetical protein